MFRFNVANTPEVPVAPPLNALDRLMTAPSLGRPLIRTLLISAMLITAPLAQAPLSAAPIQGATAPAASGAASRATVREFQRIFPTYPFGDPNPIPVVGRIYPYFRFDGFSARSVSFTRGIAPG